MTESNVTERERVLEEALRKLRGEIIEADTSRHWDNTGFGSRRAVIDYIDAALSSPLRPEGEAADLRTLVPGFRLDWSGLRVRFEEEALRLEKLTTYESRAAHLDEMARQFEDAVLAALRPPLTQPKAEEAGK